MDKLFSLTCVGGPYGDSTSAYKGTMKKDATLDEFITNILVRRNNEWGSLTIKYGDDTMIRQYNYGYMERRPRRWAKKKVNKYFSAHGGWSLMDYTITVED